MDIFYVSSRQIDLDHGRVMIDGEEFHHLARVLRKSAGESIRLTDGRGLALDVMIDAVGKRSIAGTIVESHAVPRSSTSVTVALSMLKSPQRFDLFLEKATELGVDRIVPMSTCRTVSTPSSEKIDGKVDRWRNVVLSAARQCRRYYLPEIERPMPFADALVLDGYDRRFIASETSKEPPAAGSFSGKLLFLVGGEGGFTPEETREAVRHGFAQISLGNSILRAETAGIFAVAMVRTSLLLAAPPSHWL